MSREIQAVCLRRRIHATLSHNVALSMSEGPEPSDRSSQCVLSASTIGTVTEYATTSRLPSSLPVAANRFGFTVLVADTAIQQRIQYGISATVDIR